MCECVPSGSGNMPIGGHWALRGGFAPRANPRRPNAHLPPQDMSRHPRGELFVSFYHRSQESAKMCDVMKRRTELAFEQRRKSEKSRLLQKTNNGSLVQRLERIPMSKNVTLAIEVPNTEHAGMIERMEAWADEDSIPKIMDDTGVLIQFPDLVPDAKNSTDFVNRVTLTGPLANVEEARIRIRNFTPIAISFPLWSLKSNILLEDVKDIIDKAIADKFINFPKLEIMVQVPQMPKDAPPTCIVRGAPTQERDICDACAALHRLLFDATSEIEHESAMIYSTVVDVPAVQQLAVTGLPEGVLIRVISFNTNAVIYFPTVADRNSGATGFYLYGSVHGIMQARKYIQGLLPVQLIYDVENNDLLNPVDASNREIYRRDRERDLTIRVKKSRLEGEKLTASDTLRNMVIIESSEYNLTNVYAARQQLSRDGVFENEQPIIINEFDFYERNFRSLVIRSNHLIAEKLGKNGSFTRTSLLYSRFHDLSTNIFSSTAIWPSAIVAEFKEQFSYQQAYQESVQPLDCEDRSTSSKEEDNSINNNLEKAMKETVTITAVSSVSAVKLINQKQKASEMVNMSVPEFLDLFKQSENKNINEQTQSTEIFSNAVESKMEKKCGKSADGTEKNHHKFDEIMEGQSTNLSGNAGYDLAKNIALEGASATKYILQKLPVSKQPFPIVSQSHSLITSGTNVVDVLINDQGSTTVAVAAAMLQNSPPQWFQSAGTVAALKSTDYFGHMPRLVEKIVPEAFMKPFDSAFRSMRNDTSEKFRHVKKNLVLKPSFVHENEFQNEASSSNSSKEATTSSCLKETDSSSCSKESNINVCQKETDTLKFPKETESKGASSDVRLSPLSNNSQSFFAPSGNAPNNSIHYQLSRQSSDYADDLRYYRTERQLLRARGGAVWENSRYSPSFFDSRSNTREVFSKRYQGRMSQNSLRCDLMRGGRTIRPSTTHYYSTFSRSHSNWNLSSLTNNEGKRYGNRTITHLHLKRQFVSKMQLEEKGKGDRREERCPSIQQEQLQNCTKEDNYDGNFDKESVGLKIVSNQSSPSAMPNKTKTYADITKRVDVMMLIDEVQKNQMEQTLHTMKQSDRPTLMTDELEKYSENDKSNTKSYADMAKKSTADDEKIQSKPVSQSQHTNEQEPSKSIGKEHQSDN